MQKPYCSLGAAAADKAFLKEKLSIVNSYINCSEQKVIRCYRFLVCYVPLLDGTARLATCIAREQTLAPPASSHPGLSPNVISGDATGTSGTQSSVFSRGVNKTYITAQLHRSDGKHNSSLKGERIFFKDTKSY